MPIYEYSCPRCNERFSRLQRVGAGHDGVRCPACDSEQVERLLSAFAAGGEKVAGSSSLPAPSCSGSGFS